MSGSFLVLRAASVACLLTLGVAVAPLAPARAAPQDAGVPAKGPWPQTVGDGGLSFVVYAPQYLSLAGDAVTFVQAVSKVPPPGMATAAVMGSMTVSGQVTQGADDDELELSGFVVGDFTIGGAAAEASDRDAMQRAIGGKAISITRRALVHDMQLENPRASGTPGLGDDLPTFVVANRRSVLLPLDGDPRLADIGDTGWRRVINTPFILLQAPDGSFVTRLGAARWVGSTDLAKGYAPVAAPPAQVVAALGTVPVPPVAAAGSAGSGFAPRAADAGSAPSAPLPDVLVVTEPTVLVATNGAPTFADVAPGVQWIDNCRTPLLRTRQPEAWWTLASGRWFTATALDATWSRVPPGGVPASFAALPGGRLFDAVKASVPGTPESAAAVVAAQAGRSVTVSRATARCGVRWFGEPAWRGIDGTLLRGSVNASQPVIWCDRTFYCCDGAAWFSAPAADGPWTLCESIPDAIDTISASSPLFPVTGVDIVASDASTVTFACRPAYLGTCVDAGTVAYGTGWSWPGVASPDGSWSAQPQTYGMPVAFDADTGTFAPDVADTDADTLPAVMPEVLYGGWTGWGWCPGWSSAWAWGLRAPSSWDAWGPWWQAWHPYWNRWANARTEAQRRRDDAAALELAERQRDAAEADAASEANRLREVSQEEAAWRERQRASAEAAAAADREARAEAARLRDARDAAQRERDQAEREAMRRRGPIAPRGSIEWWYQYYNDYSDGYLSRATGYRDPRYAPAVRTGATGAR